MFTHGKEYMYSCSRFAVINIRVYVTIHKSTYIHKFGRIHAYVLMRI